jgi:hypothetical protein
MAVWSFTIAADQHSPSLGDGFVRAETVEAAIAIVDHPDANLYPCPDDSWPCGATGAIVFDEDLSHER